MKADLDFGDLSLWLAVLKADPVVLGSLCFAICSVLQNELVLNPGGYFIHCDQPVVVVELANFREVLALLLFYWHVRIGFFYREPGTISLKNTLKRHLSYHVITYLFRFNRLLLLVCDAS